MTTNQTIDDFSNASRLMNLRFWLIRLIAGKCQVMLNLQIDIVPKDPDHAASFEGIRGGLFHSLVFPNQHGFMLHLTPVGSVQKYCGNKVSESRGYKIEGAEK